MPWLWPQLSGHWPEASAWGTVSGTRTLSSLKKNSENTCSYILRASVRLGISHLPSRTGLNQGGGRGERGCGVQEEMSFCSCQGVTSRGTWHLSQSVHIEVCLVGSQVGALISSGGTGVLPLPLPACPPEGLFTLLIQHSYQQHLTELADKRQGEIMNVLKGFLTLKRGHMVPSQCHLPRSGLTDH